MRSNCSASSALTTVIGSLSTREAASQLMPLASRAARRRCPSDASTVTVGAGGHAGSDGAGSAATGGASDSTQTGSTISSATSSTGAASDALGSVLASGNSDCCSVASTCEAACGWKRNLFLFLRLLMGLWRFGRDGVERMGLIRIREILAQAIGVTARRIRMAKFHFDVACQQQRSRIGVAESLETLDEGPGTEEIVLSIKSLRHVIQGQRILRVDFQRAAEIGDGLVDALAAAVVDQADAGIGIEHGRRRVERIAHRLRVVFLRLVVLALGTQELTIVVVRIAGFRCQFDRTLVVLAGFLDIADALVQDRDDGVRIDVVVVVLQRFLQVVERQFQLALLHVLLAELDADLRRVLTLFCLAVADARAAAGRLTGRQRDAERRQQNAAQHFMPHHVLLLRRGGGTRPAAGYGPVPAPSAGRRRRRCRRRACAAPWSAPPRRAGSSGNCGSCLRPNARTACRRRC